MIAADIEFSTAQHTDLDDIIRLHVAGLHHELAYLNQIFAGKEFDPKGLAQLRQLLSRLLQTGEGQIFTALHQQKIIGYCLATKKIYPVETPKICGCVNGIYVDPAYRRLGLAALLFDKACLWFRQSQISYIELSHMVNDPVSTAFWQKMGFVPVQISCSRRV